MNPRRIFLSFRILARTYLRSRVGLFFSLVFPVILILLFGAIFSNGGSGKVNLIVQDLDGHSPASQNFTRYLNSTGALSLSFVGPGVGNLSSYLSGQGGTPGLVIPAGFQANLTYNLENPGLPPRPVRVVVYTNPTTGASAGIVEGAVQGAITEMNFVNAGARPYISYQGLNVGSAVYTYIDYLIPGLIGFSVLTSPMFSMVNISSEYKKEKIFRQLSLTPLTRGEWLLSAILWYIVLTAVSAFIMIAIGALIFGAHVGFSWMLVPFLLIGPMLFTSLGLLAGSTAKDPESAAVVGNLITFPMMFLAGTFFPVSEFPSWLAVVARVLPLYYAIEGINNALLFNNVGAAAVDLLVTVVLSAVFFAGAVLAFRWRDK